MEDNGVASLLRCYVTNESMDSRLGLKELRWMGDSRMFTSYFNLMIVDNKAIDGRSETDYDNRCALL